MQEDGHGQACKAASFAVFIAMRSHNRVQLPQLNAYPRYECSWVQGPLHARQLCVNALFCGFFTRSWNGKRQALHRHPGTAAVYA